MRQPVNGPPVVLVLPGPSHRSTTVRRNFSSIHRSHSIAMSLIETTARMLRDHKVSVRRANDYRANHYKASHLAAHSHSARTSLNVEMAAELQRGYWASLR